MCSAFFFSNVFYSGVLICLPFLESWVLRCNMFWNKIFQCLVYSGFIMYLINSTILILRRSYQSSYMRISPWSIALRSSHILLCRIILYPVISYLLFWHLSYAIIPFYYCLDCIFGRINYWLCLFCFVSNFYVFFYCVPLASGIFVFAFHPSDMWLEFLS